MKKLIKICKWIFIILMLLVTGIAAIVASRQRLTYNAEYPDISASKDTAIIARGKHLVFSAAHCIDCHHKGNSDSLIQLGKEVPLSGGVSFVLPVGTIYSKNITPNKETGIGKYTDGEIARALRYGVHPDEWQNSAYPTTEFINIGQRGAKQVAIQLTDPLWLERAWLWTQGLAVWLSV